MNVKRQQNVRVIGSERLSKEIPANNLSNETSVGRRIACIPGDRDTRRKIAARNAIVSCAKRDGLLGTRLIGKYPSAKAFLITRNKMYIVMDGARPRENQHLPAPP